MEWIKLGELVEIKGGGTPLRRKKEYWLNGHIPWVKISDIKNKYVTETEEHITKLGFDNSSVKMIKKGSLIYTIFATIGKIGILNIDATTNQAIVGLEIIDIERINRSYLFYFLRSIEDEVKGKSRGVAQNNINIGILKKIRIPVPPINIQRQIVEVLDVAQSLIDNRKEQIELLDDLIESIFYDMFGDPVRNDKGWEVKKLEKSAKITTGNTPPRKNVDNYGSYIEWIKSNNINTPYMYLTEAEEYLSEQGKKIGRYVDKDSILMTCIAGSIGCIGNIAITDREVAFNQQINGITPIQYNVYFLYVLFIATKEYIQNNSTSSMKWMISKSKLSKLEFILPPISLQNKFAKQVQVIEQQKELMSKSLKLMEDNYNSLIQRAFKGELF